LPGWYLASDRLPGIALDQVNKGYPAYLGIYIGKDTNSFSTDDKLESAAVKRREKMSSEKPGFPSNSR